MLLLLLPLLTERGVRRSSSVLHASALLQQLRLLLRQARPQGAHLALQRAAGRLGCLRSCMRSWQDYGSLRAVATCGMAPHQAVCRFDSGKG